ncbi:MAG TPA: serine hydrolase domain-containing protein [Trebonia sp.]|nr:serine hydrolase domain-containing protein [Trebonia sp.]
MADPRSSGQAPIAAVRDVDGIVAAAARRAFAGSPEVGMQVAVWLGGDLIVDVGIGYADTPGGRPVDSNTIFPVFSVTKGLVATAIHRAADDGLLDLTAPVSAYWPGFAAGGKASATVADALTHSVGIPAMPDGCTVEQMCDWQYMTSAVEAMPAMWQPGRATGYHAYTYGWIAGELLRRVRGDDDPSATMSNALAELGVSDFWIGLPEAQLGRVATLHASPGGPARGPNALFDRALPAATRPQPRVFNRPEVQRACLPAAGGIGTAAALARLYGRLAAAARAGDAADRTGSERLPVAPATAAAAARLQTDAEDRVLGRRIRKSLGYFLSGGDSPQTVPMGQHAAFGHPGSGGSTAWADTTLGAGIAITKNWMAGPAEPSILIVADAARAAAVRALQNLKNETSS